MRPNAKLMQASLTGALGGLLYGFDTVVISGIIDSVAKLYSLSPTGVGLTVAASPVGNILGCFCAGVIGKGSARALRCALPLRSICVPAWQRPSPSAGPCCSPRAL